MIVIDPIFTIIDIVLQMYIWILIATAILSWLVAFNVVNTRNQFVYQVGNVLYRLTEPALRPIRRFVPNFGGVDISYVVLWLLVTLARMILANVHARLLFG
ncbi:MULTISPECIES: YggT family protein [Inquilinus]|uniref:YggT family protein n=1 Tax=Inquilinus ginsengisoli TaxID=363840 RepID=A0ABU1JM44_9PROT|nr:YggT family protein [Inquilinus ginsengisoli]MDR6289683.1 YggT family protein [Inquilinus ginsengisoli]